MSYTAENSSGFIVKDVTKTFSKNEVVINGISLMINRGDFIAILGVSGIGKSTVLKILSGLLTPTKGEVIYSGISVKKALNELMFGCVFQHPVLAGWRNVLENVLLPLEITKPKEQLNVERAYNLLKAVGLENDLHKYPRELSGGMQQRLSLAMTLSYNPEVLFLDEAFGSLDAITRRKLQSLLLNIWGELHRSKTVVFVTHDVSEACFMADRIFILRKKPVSDIEELIVPFPRPRDFSLLYSSEFKEIAEEAYNKMSGNGV